MGELVMVVVIILVMFYPYLLVLRLLQLVCKALKKYLSE